MFVKNIITIIKKYKFSIYKILYYEFLFALKGFKGNKIDFTDTNEFSGSIPCPYYFLVKIKKFLEQTKIESFLDLGSGSGRVIYFFNKYFNIKFYGIEVFDKPYNFSKTLFSKNSNIEILNEDFRNLNFLLKNVDCFFLNEPLKNKKDFKSLIDSIFQKYSKIGKKYYIILVNVTKDDLKAFSNLHLVDFEIINTRGYYIYSN